MAEYSDDDKPISGSSPPYVPPPSTWKEGNTVGGIDTLEGGPFLFIIDEAAREYDKQARAYLREMRKAQEEANQPLADDIFVNAIIFNLAGHVLTVRPRYEKSSSVEPIGRYTLPGAMCKRNGTKLLMYLAGAVWDHVSLRITRVRHRSFTDTWPYQEIGTERLMQTLSMSFFVDVVDAGALSLERTRQYSQHHWATEDEVRSGHRWIDGVQQEEEFQLASNTMRCMLPLAFNRWREIKEEEEEEEEEQWQLDGHGLGGNGPRWELCFLPLQLL